jgi:hypothetical protein
VRSADSRLFAFLTVSSLVPYLVKVEETRESTRFLSNPISLLPFRPVVLTLLLSACRRSQSRFAERMRDFNLCQVELWGLIPMLMAVVGSKPGHGNPVAGLESAITQSHPDLERV